MGEVMSCLQHAYYQQILEYIRSLTGMVRDAHARTLRECYQALADYEAALNGAAEAKVKLNLGSSDTVLRGFVNVDAVPAPGVEVADLTKPWPWADSSVDYVRASHIIEHLPDKIFTMNELWRVLKAGSKADIAVPTTDGPGAWQDPTHVSFWNRRSFLYFEHGSPYREWSARSYRIAAKFRTVRERIDQTFDGPILAITVEAVKA
jgi:SAM-dependent methyltransferase